MVRTFAKNPIEALQLAGSEFGRLANQITTGACRAASQHEPWRSAT